MKNALLKFVACGSVDDGKSTLIGHLLYNAKKLYVDQEKSLELESRVYGSDGRLDYSLLLDGLIAEREQKITIDVAYRYFNTEVRSFIVADTPGHVEYTRNMAVGASFADLAVILVDAGKGLVTQTRRHVRICSLMGIRYFVFTVNKMDLAGYAEDRFREIRSTIYALQEELRLGSVCVIPVSAAVGDNITELSPNMPWYKGKPLLQYLEEVDAAYDSEEGFVLPVQRVARPDSTYRGYQGEIASGSIRLHDTVTVLPNGVSTTVSSIIAAGEYTEEACRGDAVTIALTDETDVSRGSVFIKDTSLQTNHMFEGTVLWMDDEPMIEGKSYFIKLASQTKPVSVMRIKFQEDIDSGKQLSKKKIEKNELACVDFVCSDRIVYDAFQRHRELGSFILIDRLSNHTAGAGVILHSLRRSTNVVRQDFEITRETRAQALGQNPKTIWFTGLSGSGKSTLANALEKELALSGSHTMLLDGDNIRMGLNKNLGFHTFDRMENIRRVAEVCRLFNDAGLIVLTAMISPFEQDRERARRIVGENDFIEVYVSTPLEECERRDVKGLYKKARSGDIPNFTGVNSPYEVPVSPDITIDTSGRDPEDCIAELLNELEVFLK